jgi:ABC-2 type transport system permease protein
MLCSAVGGSMIPGQFMPGWMKPIQSTSPIYWSLDAFLALMRGDTFASVLPSVAVLLAIAVVLFGIGVWRLRYE